MASCINKSEKESSSDEIWQDLLSEEQAQFYLTGDATFQYEQGVLSLEGGPTGGWMLFEEDFKNLELTAEFFLEKDQRAGLGFRSDPQSKENPSHNGYLVVLDHLADQQNTMGSIINVARAKTLKGIKADDWNGLKVKAVADHLQIFINDTLVTETHNRNSEDGQIGLFADVNGKVKFKNLKIRELPEPDIADPLLEDYMRGSDKPFRNLITDDNLENWKPIGEATWDIEDGVIHGYSNEKGGFLVHESIYRNFYLKFKFRIKHEDNSGIFIRHNPAVPDAVTTDNAIECNIYDHNGFEHEYSTGSIAGHARSWSKMIDYEDWNTMEIFASDDQICMYVNDQKSSESHLPEKFNIGGNICIQGGIQVFNGDLPSDIYIKEMMIRDFDEQENL